LVVTCRRRTVVSFPEGSCVLTELDTLGTSTPCPFNTSPLQFREAFEGNDLEGCDVPDCCEWLEEWESKKADNNFNKFCKKLPPTKSVLTKLLK